MKFRQQLVRGVTCNCSLFPHSGLIKKMENRVDRPRPKPSLSKGKQKMSLKQTQLQRNSQQITNKTPQIAQQQSRLSEYDLQNRDILNHRQQFIKKRDSIYLLQRKSCEKVSKGPLILQQNNYNPLTATPLYAYDNKSIQKKSITNLKHISSISEKKKAGNKLIKLSEGHFQIQTIRELNSPSTNDKQSKTSFTTMTCSHFNPIKQRNSNCMNQNNKNHMNIVPESIQQENYKKNKFNKQYLILSDLMCRQAESLVGEGEQIDDNQFSIVLNQGNRNITLQCPLEESIEIDENIQQKIYIK